MLGGVLAVALLAVAAVLVVVQVRDDDPAAGPADNPATTSRPPRPADASGIALGPEDAAHTVVVYEDLLCSHCAEFHEGLGRDLVERARAGEIRLVVRLVSFLATTDVYSPESANAVLVTRDVAGDDVAFALQESLLAQQPPTAGPFPDAAWLVEQAVAAGADEDAVREGVESGSRADDVAEATRAAQMAGVARVPSVFVDDIDVAPGGEVDDVVTATREALG